MLPALHDAWFRVVTGAAAPEEGRATCSRCAMARQPDDPPDAQGTFSNDLKCCTYTPRLPNFLVGRILADTADDPVSVAGQSSVAARIEGGVDATPLALEASRVYGLLYAHGSSAGFGVAPSLLCPHFHSATGSCGIWRHRESVCATYYCKYERGALGAQMWNAARCWFHAVEETLSWHAALELGLGDDALARLLARGDLGEGPLDAASLGAGVDERELEERWGPWAGRHREYYLKAWDIVRELRPEDVLRLGGVKLEARARALARAWRELTTKPELPRRLHGRHLTVLNSGNDRCVVGTYSPNDPLSVPRELVAALPRFDGRPTVDVLEEIENEHGLKLDKSLLRKLADFDVLKPLDP